MSTPKRAMTEDGDGGGTVAEYYEEIELFGANWQLPSEVRRRTMTETTQHRPATAQEREILRERAADLQRFAVGDKATILRVLTSLTCAEAQRDALLAAVLHIYAQSHDPNIEQLAEAAIAAARGES